MATALSPGEQHCARHGTTYTALRPCQQCFADPGPPLDAEQIAEIDAQDLDDEAFARRCAAELHAIATQQQERRDENGSQDRIGAATIIKAYEAAAKFIRLARDIRAEWKSIERDNKLLEHDREMAGLRGSH